jgi:hypothetical protein
MQQLSVHLHHTMLPELSSRPCIHAANHHQLTLQLNLQIHLCVQQLAVQHSTVQYSKLAAQYQYAGKLSPNRLCLASVVWMSRPTFKFVLSMSAAAAPFAVFFACRVTWTGAHFHAQGDCGVQRRLPIKTVLLVRVCTDVQVDIGH